MIQIVLSHREIRRSEVRHVRARSRYGPPVRKKHSPDPLPNQVCRPGDQCDDDNHQVDMLAGSAPEGVLDQKSQPIDHYHYLGENDIGPPYSESQMHRMPQIRQRDRNENPPDYIEARGAQCIGSAEINIWNGFDSINDHREKINSKRHRKKHYLLELID